MASELDRHFMRYALDLARQGLGRTAPNPSVGCVIARNETVLGAARTADGGRPHAETQALAQAGMAAKGSTAYISLEPCSHIGKTGPCAQALIDAGISKVFSACTDPNPKVSGTGLVMLRNAKIEVLEGLCEHEALRLNKGFFITQTDQRPLVTIKIAVSLDGKIAMSSGESKWITGDLARRKAHQLRSQHDAIMVGIGTVTRDDPQLSTRLDGLIHRPVRVIMDSKLRINRGSKLVQMAGHDPLWIMHDGSNAARISELEQHGVKLFACDINNLKSVLKILAENGITRLLVEGGGLLQSSFLKAGLFDEMIVMRAARIFGGSARDSFGGLDIETLSHSLNLIRTGHATLGVDTLETYERL